MQPYAFKRARARPAMSAWQFWVGIYYLPADLSERRYPGRGRRWRAQQLTRDLRELHYGDARGALGKEPDR